MEDIIIMKQDPQISSSKDRSTVHSWNMPHVTCSRMFFTRFELSGQRMHISKSKFFMFVNQLYNSIFHSYPDYMGTCQLLFTRSHGEDVDPFVIQKEKATQI